MKARPELMKFFAAVDVHAPNKARTNVIVSNFDDFYDTFDVKPDDGMYREPSERTMIW